MPDKRREIFNFTVGELTEILKEYPTDMPVIVSGYETGNILKILKSIERELKSNNL